MYFYELFKQGPAIYIPVLLTSLVITLLGYSVFPIVFAKIRKKPITKKKYVLICYCVNFLVAILFTLLDGKFSTGPYILWTCIFTTNGVSILRKRYLLERFKPVEDLFGDKDENDSDKPADTSAEELPAKDIQTANHAQIVNIVEPTNNNKNTKQKKVKYCSHCGSLIDNETKICSGCGKKCYKGIRFTKTSVIIVVLSVLLLASLIVIGILLSKEHLNKNEILSDSQKTDYYVDENGVIYSFEDWIEENKSELSVQWLSEYRFLYYNDLYVLLFELSDESEKAIAASGKVDIRIVNDKNITVYDKTRRFTKENFEYWTYDETKEMYVATIYINPGEIKKGNTEFGTVYFTVYGDSYNFEEISTSTSDLPISSDTTVVTQSNYNTNSYSYSYTCLNSYCKNEVIKSGAYCSEHKCENGNCEYERKSNSKYCYSCSCDTSGCLNAKIPNGSYCAEHICKNDNCGYEREPNSQYCSICLCGVAGCSNVQMTNGYYCLEHICSEPTCEFSKSLDEKYCSYHACDICGELRASGRLYCAEHS